MAVLSEHEIEHLLREAPSWQRDGVFLKREIVLPTAKAAIALFNKIADAAEDQGHHPDLTWVYNRLSIKLTTHDEGGITYLDGKLARTIDDLAGD